MHAARAALLLVCICATPASRAEDDLLSLAHAAAESLVSCERDGWLDDALRQEVPPAMVGRIAAQLAFPPGIHGHLLGPDGRCWFSTRSSWGTGSSSREGMGAMTSTGSVGVASDVAVNDAGTELVRRDFAWKWIEDGGLSARVVIERERVLDQDEANPWSGKWIGAYTRQQTTFTAGDAQTVNSASSLSAIILQSGVSCWVRLVAGDQVFESNGTIHDHRLRAGAPDPVQLLDLRYDPTDDRLRGHIDSVTPEQSTETRIFLQRLAEE